MGRFGRWIYERPWLLLFFTALFWAGNAIVGRAAVTTVPPIGLAFWRWFLAFLILLPFSWRPILNDRLELRRSWPLILGLGLVGIATFNTCLYIGLGNTQAINAGLLQAAMPAIIVIFLLFLGEKPGWRELVGMGLALTGVVITLFKGDWQLLMSFSLNRGDAWIFGGVLFYSTYSVGLRWRPPVHPMTFLSLTFMTGWVALLPLYIWESFHTRPVAFGWESILAVVYVAIFPSILAYVCFNRGVELLGPSKAGLTLYFVPILVSLLAVLLLGEPFRLYHLAGLALILGGVVFAQLRRNGSGKADRDG